MSFSIVATACPSEAPGSHMTRTRWRSDDPWGAIWRCLYEAASMYIPKLIDPTRKHEVCTIRIVVEFDPTGEDVTALTEWYKAVNKIKRGLKLPDLPGAHQ